MILFCLYCMSLGQSTTVMQIAAVFDIFVYNRFYLLITLTKLLKRSEKFEIFLSVLFFLFFFLFWKERLTHFAWFFSDILLRLLKQESRQKPYCNLLKKDFGKCIKGKIAKLTTAEFRQKLSSLFWCFCYHY